MSFGFAPKGWALSSGQLLPIIPDQALFSLLGTTYGGDERVNFALPNLMGRAPVHKGKQQIRKQRHTAKLIFERLKQEHRYAGGYTVVKDYVREQSPAAKRDVLAAGARAR